jgi:hypothetical protein
VEEAMIDAIKGFVGGWRSIAIAAGLAVTVGFGTGWKVKGWQEGAKRERIVEAQKQAHLEDLAEYERERDRLEAQRLALASELEAARANIRTVTREIIREVPKYVQDSSPTCDRSVSPDLALLYNRSLGLGPASPEAKGYPTGRGDGAVRLAGGNGDGSSD